LDLGSISHGCGQGYFSAGFWATDDNNLLLVDHIYNMNMRHHAIDT
jgi:hypothetical protein